MKKYEFTDETIDFCGRKLTRIRAVIDFGSVKAGNLGGFIEKESNLSHDGNAWVSGNADYICIKGLGRFNRSTTFFRTEQGVSVVCGCFTGTLEDFEAKVFETHGNSIYAKEYLAAVEVAKIHFCIAEKK
jgi:hypothetical protein